MKKLTLALTLALAPSFALAQSMPTWKSYMATGNTADIVPSAGTSDSVAAWLAKKVDVTSGYSTNQTLTTPTITGGSSTNQTLTGASIDGSSMLYGPTNSLISAQLISTGIQVTPQMFGAVGDGITDDTPAIQSAVDALCAYSHVGGVLYLPSGRYLMSNISVPCEGLYIEGAGIGNRDTPTGTEIYNNSTSNAPLIYFNYAKSNYAYGGGVSNLSIFNAGANESSGPQIEADYVQQFSVENVYSFHAFSVVKLIGGRANHISHLYAEDILAGGIGIELLGTGAAGDATGQLTRMDTPVLNDVSLNAGAPTNWSGSRHMTGIYAHGFVQTLQMHNVEMTNPYYGLLVDCTVADGSTIQATSIGACPGFFDLSDVEIDFADVAAFRFSDFSFFKMRGTYAHGGNGTANYNNLQAYAPNFNSFGLEILGGKFDQAQGSCIYSAANNTRVIGADIHHCNIGAHSESSSGSAGVEFGVDTKTGDNFGGIIASNNFCETGPDATSAMDGIYIASSLGYVSVTGNTFLGCRSGYTYTGTNSNMADVANVGP